MKLTSTDIPVHTTTYMFFFYIL